MQKLFRTPKVMANIKAVKIALFAPVVAILVLTLSAVPAGANSTKTFIALLNAGQEVPPTPSEAFGVAFMTFNETTKLLCYSISFSALIGVETAAHFHGPAEPGQNAPILFFITPGPSPVGSPKTGCVGPLNGKQSSDLKRGLFYINVHTGNVFPDGEIRGQVLWVK